MQKINRSPRNYRGAIILPYKQFIATANGPSRYTEQMGDEVSAKTEWQKL